MTDTTSNISDKVFQAVEYAVFGKRVYLSIHAILRFIERNYNEDIVAIRLGMNTQWRSATTATTRNNTKISDTELFRYLHKNHKSLIERAKDDINFYVQNKTYNFVADDLQFIIRDATLITVYEV